MTIEWLESYKIGNAEIDAAQIALFELANQIAASDDWMAVRPMIVTLYKQMQRLFELEDALMTKLAYTGAQAHAEDHQSLLTRLQDRSMDVGKGHMNKKAIVAVMTDWAHRHVVNQDAELAQYLAVWA
ncbi:hemerythrin domain-containing protein [Rhodoferax sp.]|uniref:bacteriohemerythrin n=1 Tax=Rhodoferax sp. TaxID=50421 RepID=UPI002840DDE5|nr:hemerythrin domain-containing protein [Rhodoferax sp.]MDR3371263.1 hemerythrin domain-containing protein [Rhodoferax sp.]